MMVNNDSLQLQLQEFGLNSKQVQVYLILLQKGILSPSEISRFTNINRTTVYRIIEELKIIGLVEEIVAEHSTKTKAVSPEKLQMIVMQKELELQKMKNNLPLIIAGLVNNIEESHPSTKVKYFRGQEGMKQLLWNTLQADPKRGVVGYGYSDWNEYVGKQYAEKIRQEYVERKIPSLEILNNPVRDKSAYTDNKIYASNIHQSRKISKEKLEINHNLAVYNDVFCFYSLYDNELFGIEIHNHEIAKTQRQIFYLLWEMALQI